MNDRTMLFSDLAATFLSEQKPRLRENSFSNMRYNLESYLLPVFGEIGVAEFSEAKIIDGMKEVGDKSKISAGTLKTNFILVKQIARFGMKKGLVPPFLLDFKIDFEEIRETKSNVSENSAGEKSGDAKTELSEDDARKIILAARENPDCKKLGVLLSLCLGLKIGEICALRWSDIDLPNGKVRISRTVCRIDGGDGTSRVVEQEIGGGGRVSAIPESVAAFLAEHFGERLAGNSMQSEFFVLTDKDKPAEPRALRRGFAAFLEEIGVGQVKFGELKKFYDARRKENALAAERETGENIFQTAGFC